MYLLNYLSLQAIQTRFIEASRLRSGQQLVGVRDGSNVLFTTGSEKFVHNLPFISVQVYLNGVRLTLLDDYTVAESAGPGTGYDTVILEVAPRSREKLYVDYIVAPTP